MKLFIYLQAVCIVKPWSFYIVCVFIIILFIDWLIDFIGILQLAWNIWVQINTYYR